PIYHHVIEELLPTDVQEVLRLGEEAAELSIGDRQVDLRREDAGRLRAQHVGPAAGRPHVVRAQEARVLVEEPELARARRRDVPGRVGQEEEPSLLEDELGVRQRLRLAADLLVSEELSGRDRNQLLRREKNASHGSRGPR